MIITDALDATGNWEGVAYLKALELKGIGDPEGPSLADWNTTLDSGVSANATKGGADGCTAGGTSGACFYRDAADPFALSNNMTFDISFSGGTNFDDPNFAPS